MNRSRLWTALFHGMLILAVLVILVPFLWMVSISFKYFRDIFSGSFVFTPTLSNYAALFRKGSNFTSYFANSLIVSFAAMVTCTAVGALGAYSLSRFRWHPWIPKAILWWVLLVQTLPAVTFVGPYYLLSLSFNLYNTRLILVLVYVLFNLPLVIWMMNAYYRQIPVELEEAAAVDGCTRWQAFYKVVLPTAAPGLAASAIMAFIFSWKEFLLAVTLTSTPRAMTVPVAIAGFIQDYAIQYGEMAAASTLATLPGLIVVAVAQRYLVAGLTSGAIKS